MRLIASLAPALLCVVILRQPLAMAASDLPPDSPRTPNSNVEEKKPWLAPVLSTGATMAGYGIAVVSTTMLGHVDRLQVACLLGGAALAFVGPSAGNIYAGNTKHVVLFNTGRFVMTGVAFVGLMGLIARDGPDSAHYGSDSTPYMVLFVGGIGGFLALSIWEIIDGYSSAKAFNRRHREHGLSLTPSVIPGKGANSAASVGLSLTGRF